MQAYAIAIARNVRTLWFGSLAALKPLASGAPGSNHASASQAAAGRATDVPRYSFEYRNGTRTLQDPRRLAFPTDRAAKREALRTARAMARNVSWQASARVEGWAVLVMDPRGRKICEVPVRSKQRWF
jgi:hypothetical protein